jgi:hypothetical protein
VTSVAMDVSAEPVGGVVDPMVRSPRTSSSSRPEITRLNRGVLTGLRTG